MKLTLAAEDTPEGYESEAEYRIVKNGEECLDDYCQVMTCKFDQSWSHRIVLTPKRWRADQNGTYFVIASFGEIIAATDHYMLEDKQYYELGNYFRTEEDALPYQCKWAELFLP